MSDMDDIIREFLVESRENLDQLDRDLVALEDDPLAHDLLASIFRTIHTIKGTSGFLAFARLEAITHAGEGLLSQMRDGQLQFTRETTSALLTLVDTVRAVLVNIESTGREGEGDDSGLIQRIRWLQEPQAKSSVTSANSDAELTDPKHHAAASEEEYEKPLGQWLVENAGVAPSAITAALETQQQGDGRRLGEILVERGLVSPSAVNNVIEYQKEARSRSVADTSVRVDVALLDTLMNRVGELVLARNQITQSAGREHNSAFMNACQRLNLVTTELQGLVMKARLQPIGHLWARLPRIVRDLAVACGKQVRVEMEGNETELDKSLIEAIKDPLTHLIRNAVDHGIEQPDQRLAAGKPAEGRIRLFAWHQGGQVIVEIADDGVGINLDRVRQKALALGLACADEAAAMDDHAVANLVFHCGLSTAGSVTNVSGRGVGMDVVKTNIQEIGGTVDLQTSPGQGTTVRMSIPLTLAIIPALIVSCGGERYAIPQVNLVELVRLDGDAARRSVETVQGVPVTRLRGRLLPLVRLSTVLSGAPLARAQRDSQLLAQVLGDNPINIVVLQAGIRKLGLIVDAISDTEEIVVKPLGRQLRSISAFAGATIMGDGKAALILDVAGLAQRGFTGDENQDTVSRENRPRQNVTAAGPQEIRRMLLFQCGDRGRMAIDLSQVSRLEEFAPDAIEIAGDREVVQYRGRIMPLLRVTEWFGSGKLPAPDFSIRTLQVVVCACNVGLVVDRIFDIADEPVVIQPGTGRSGVLGTAILQKRATEVLDLRWLQACADNARPQEAEVA